MNAVGCYVHYWFSTLTSLKSYVVSLLRDRTLLGDVDSIKELTQILIAHVGSLLNLSRGEGNKSNIVPRESNLILNISRPVIFHSILESNLAHPLLSQKVADLNFVAIEGNIDGKVGIHEAHLVLETTCDSNEHVVDMRAHGTDAGELLAVGEPQVNTDRVVSYFAEVHVDVLEVAFKTAARSGDLNMARFDLHGD